MVEARRPLKLKDIGHSISKGDVLRVCYQGRPRETMRGEIRVVGIDDKSGKGGQLNVIGCSPEQWGGGRDALS